MPGGVKGITWISGEILVIGYRSMVRGILQAIRTEMIGDPIILKRKIEPRIDANFQ